jgi:hypothetical protein
MTGFVSSDPLDNLTNVYQRPPCITALRAPTVNDVQPPMTLWQDNAANPPIIYQTTGAGVWNQQTFSDLDTLSDTASTIVEPTAGNIQLNGTANQIASTAGSSEITFSIPSTFVAPGSITSTTTMTSGTGITATTGNIVATAGNITTTAGSITSATSITATSGNITATNGNLVMSTAGNKLVIPTGSNASIGTATLSSGAVTVNNSSVTANSQIFLANNASNGTVGSLYVANKIPGGSFEIHSSSGSDASTVTYLIIN